MTGEEMCEEIVAFLAPNADDEKRVELACGLWMHSPTGELGGIISLYNWIRTQQILSGDREQDPLPDEPKFGDQALRLFLIGTRRVVRRMTYTGSFWHGVTLLEE